MNAVEQAEHHIVAYENQSAVAAFELVERKMRGEGCLCQTCLKAAVRNANDWIDYLNTQEYDMMHYAVKGNHIVQLKPGEDPNDFPPIEYNGRYI